MAWRVEFADEAERDLDLIFDHLLESYQEFGEGFEEAFARAEARVRMVRRAADRLGTAPHRGERHDALLPGLRHVTMDRAVYWFEVDEAMGDATAGRVRVLAVFWGGQEHTRRMLARLLR